MAYLPEERELEIYRKWYKQFYDIELLKLFDQAVELNMRSLHQLNDNARQFVRAMGESILRNYSRVFFYGKGRRGKSLYQALDEVCGKDITQKIEFVVSSKEVAEENKCLRYADIVLDPSDDIIFLTANVQEIRDALISEKKHWLEVPPTIWSVLERVYSR